MCRNDNAIHRRYQVEQSRVLRTRNSFLENDIKKYISVVISRFGQTEKFEEFLPVSNRVLSYWHPVSLIIYKLFVKTNIYQQHVLRDAVFAGTVIKFQFLVPLKHLHLTRQGNGSVADDIAPDEDSHTYQHRPHHFSLCRLPLEIVPVLFFHYVYRLQGITFISLPSQFGIVIPTCARV